MKFGIRKPSLKKSLKARTTGKLKRSVKKALIPGYGKKGMGWIKNPKKAAYNKIYNKTSVSLFSPGITSRKTSRKKTTNTTRRQRQSNQFESQSYSYMKGKTDIMKVCKFCGTENRDSATVCSSCGGNEFNHKCGNCGTVFQEGNFCPKCGVKVGAKAKKCPNCGAEYYSAACPDCGYINKANSATAVYTNTTAQPAKKKKTWLWILGWIFIFPVPLTIMMVRNQKLEKGVKIGIIAAAWILYLIIGLSGNSSETTGAEDAGKNSTASETTATQTESTEQNIKKLSFLRDEDVTVKVGKKSSSSYLKVSVKSTSNFSPDDVVFVSKDPDIAVINYTHDALTTYLYYEIIGVSGGETEVYATSKDGSIESEHIKVIVPTPIGVDSITTSVSDTSLYLGEKIKIETTILPTNAEEKTLTWSSSDDSVATVDDSGTISAVGGGVTTITVIAKSGVSSAVEVTVDDSKQMMGLKVTHPRQDDNSIGDSWTYVTEINGEHTTGSIAVAAGDKLTFHAKFTEDDDNPDIGEATKSYTITEEDLVNGFTITMDLYVTENGGQNSGKSAYFIVTYTFTP